MVPIGLVPIFVILLILIPVTGLTVGLLAKTLAKMRGASEPPADVAKLAAQVASLQDQVESLSSQVERLEAAQEFDRELLGGETS